jgi:hypothetical protein
LVFFHIVGRCHAQLKGPQVLKHNKVNHNKKKNQRKKKGLHFGLRERKAMVAGGRQELVITGLGEGDEE